MRERARWVGSSSNGKISCPTGFCTAPHLPLPCAHRYLLTTTVPTPPPRPSRQIFLRSVLLLFLLLLWNTVWSSIRLPLPPLNDSNGLSKWPLVLLRLLVWIYKSVRLLSTYLQINAVYLVIWVGFQLNNGMVRCRYALEFLSCLALPLLDILTSVSPMCHVFFPRFY